MDEEIRSKKLLPATRQNELVLACCESVAGRNKLISSRSLKGKVSGMGFFPKFGQGARRINRYLNRIANIISAIVIFIMMFYITADVLGRDIFSRPIPGTYEVSEMLMVLVVFLGLAYTQAMGGHIRTEVLLRFFPPRGRLIVEIISNLAFFIVFGFLVWEGTKKQSSPGVKRNFWQVSLMSHATRQGGLSQSEPFWYVSSSHLILPIALEASYLKRRSKRRRANDGANYSWFDRESMYDGSDSIWNPHRAFPGRRWPFGIGAFIW